MNLDRKYLILALCYAVAGMLLGIYMAASQDHTQHVSHAHILLVGFAASFIYAVIHRLWLAGAAPRLALAQFVLHQAGAITMFVGLLLLYGERYPAASIEPVLAAASLAVMIAAALMLVIVVAAGQRLPERS